MAERQDGHNLFIITIANPNPGIFGLEQYIGMRNHCPLRRACCARGINQQGRIIGLHRINALVPFSGKFIEMRAAQVIDIIHEHDFVVLKGFQPFIFQHDNLFDFRQRSPHFEIFIQLLFIFDDQKARRAIDTNMLDLHRRVCRVHAIGNAATAHNRHIEKQPFFAVFSNDGHHIARLQPHLHQGSTDFARALIIIVPAKAVPNTEFLFAHCQAVAQFSAPFAEKLRQAFTTFDNG